MPAMLTSYPLFLWKEFCRYHYCFRTRFRKAQ
jgi:hypothetical protein